MSQVKKIADRIIIQHIQARNDCSEENEAFEDTVVKVEAYDSERQITRMLQSYVSETAEERRLVRKVDIRLLPILGLLYAVQSLDRAGMNTQRMTDKARQLYQDNTGYSSSVWLLLILYSLLIVISNLTLSRSRPSRYLSGMMLASGVLSTIVSKAGSVRTLLYGRIPVVLFEAAFLPGAIYVLSCWYKPHEISRRVAMFPTIGIATQIISTMTVRYGPSSVNMWRSTFLADGVITIVVAIIGFFALPDYPGTTRSFTRRERELALVRIIRTGQDTGSSTSKGVEALRPLQAIFAAVVDPRTIVAVVIGTMATAAGTLSHLLTTSTIQTGYNALRAHKLTIPVYLIAIIGINFIAWSSPYSRTRVSCMAFGIVLAMMGGAVAQANISEGTKVIAATFFATGIWSAIAQSLTYAASSIQTPAEKRAVVIAIVHAVSGIGSIVGCSLYPVQSRSRQTSSAVMVGLYLIFALIALVTVTLGSCMGVYRGTRAERDLCERRRVRWTEVKDQVSMYDDERQESEENNEKRRY